MSGGQRGLKPSSAVVPFCILPSRGLFTAFTFLFMGVGILVAWYLDTLPTGLLVIIGAFLLYSFIEECLYLRSGSRYWIGVTEDGIETSSPIVSTKIPWSQLSDFVVREHRSRVSRSYSIEGQKTDGGKISLEVGDFATGLDPNRANAAKILCGFLNEAKERIQRQGLQFRRLELEVPLGLVTAQCPASARKSKSKPLVGHSKRRDAGVRDRKKRTPTVVRN